MKVGDKRTMTPHDYQETPWSKNKSTMLPCTVVYIHPDRRFYVVEFESLTGKWRETYYFPGRKGY